MALTCLRKLGETRPIFSPDIPTHEELEKIKCGLKDGDIEETLLKKFFPMAYEGVLKNDVLEYHLKVHNKILMDLDRYTKTGLVEWCKAYPGTIIERKDKGWLVERVDGKRLIMDSEVYPGIKAVEDEMLEKGSRVVIHRDKIHLVLNEEEYKEAVELFKT